MTWECLIRAHGFNNAWVRERERGRARTPTRSNCLRNKTEQTSSLRKSLQENKLVTRLTPLTVLLSEAENDNNNKKNNKNLHCKLASMVVKFSPAPPPPTPRTPSRVSNAYQKASQSHNLPCRWHRGTGEEKALFSSRAGFFDCIHKPPQRKINQRHTFIKYTFASLSFVKIFNKYCWCKKDKKREGYGVFEEWNCSSMT